MAGKRNWASFVLMVWLGVLAADSIESAEIKTRSKELILPKSQMFHHAFHTRSNLWYFACSREPLRMPRSSDNAVEDCAKGDCHAANATGGLEHARNCHVVMVPNLFDNKRNFEKRCRVVLRPELPDGEIRGQIFLRLFNEITVLVQWAEQQRNATVEGRRRVALRFTVVHLFENCRTVEVKIAGEEEEDSSGGSLLSRSDLFIQGRTFSVLYPDAGLCRDSKCKTTFDTEGNVLSGPVPWLLSSPNEVVRVYQIPSRSYHWLTTLVERSNSSKVLLVDAVGSSTTLQASGADKDWIQVSTANGYLGWCWRDAAQNTSLVCSQYDAFGLRLFDDVRIDMPAPVGFARPYNLPWGGLLLAVAERTGTRQNRHYHVLRLHRDGRVSGLLEFSTPGCKTPRYKLYSKEDNIHEFCLEVECYDENYYDLVMHSFYDLLPESLERETNKRYSK